MMLMCLGLGEVQMEEGQRPAKRTHTPPPRQKDILPKGDTINQNFSFLILQLPR